MKSRWLQRVLIGLVFLVTLVILFYAEEDWRGARELALVKKELAAKGENLDPAELTPPPVPDEINVAMAPIFADLYDGNGMPKAADAVRLRAFGDFFDAARKRADARLFGVTSADDFSLAAWQKALTGRSDPATAREDVAGALGKLQPLADEVEAALARPAIRWPVLTPGDPINEPRPYLGPILPLCNFFALRGLVAVEAGDGAAALHDVEQGFHVVKLADGQMLIGYLLRASSLQCAYGVISYGLRKGVWDDAQLEQLQALLDGQDELGAYKESLREERRGQIVSFSISAQRIREMRAENVRRARQMMDSAGKDALMRKVFKATAQEADSEQALELFCVRWLPRGWRNLDEACLLQTEQRILDAIDSRAGVVDVTVIDRIRGEAKRVQNEAKWPRGRWMMILRPSSLSAVMGATPHIPRAAKSQALLAEARAACALERERRRTGVLPETLPFATVDPTGDGPLRYVREGDGYLLYSLGWNRQDEGGMLARSTSVDYIKKSGNSSPGNWPWPSRPGLLRVKDY